MPPVKENICDECGGELYQREDDVPETVKNRLNVYTESTKDLIEYYSERGLLSRANGGSDVDDLFVEVKGVFSQKGLS